MVKIDAKGMGDIKLGSIRQGEVNIYGSSKISFSNRPELIAHIYGTGKIVKDVKD